MNTALTSLICAMAVSCAVCIALRNRRCIGTLMPVCSIVLMVLALNLCVPVLGGEVIDDGPFYMDPLSAVFMVLVAVVGCMASVYSRAYMGLENREGVVNHRELGQYYSLLIVFVSVMMLTFAARSMAIVWLGVGATTLVSTFLVGFYSREESTEAAWKYIILCSVGITIALAGYTLVYASTVGVIEHGALDWPVLMAHAQELDPTMMRMAMVLVIVGFGTKVGFVPMHTWLPDAHSQAPSPVSGLLSAVLLNCAMYGILRFHAVSEITVPGFSSTILMAFGLVSLAVAAFFIASSRDLKRMLAYSSIENMGLIALGFGIGTPVAVTGAVLQMVAHSVTKPVLFFSAGNIIQSYGTRDMSAIRGVGRVMPGTSWLLAAGTLAIVGAPPFAVFVGELTILSGMLGGGLVWLAAVTVVLLCVVFAGFARNVFPMLSGDPPSDVPIDGSFCRIAPIAVLMALSLSIGLFMPEQAMEWIGNAVGTFTGVVG